MDRSLLYLMFVARLLGEPAGAREEDSVYEVARRVLREGAGAGQVEVQRRYAKGRARRETPEGITRKRD
jgi:hypothetical protein